LPGYGLYLGSGLLGMGRNALAGMQGGQGSDGAAAAPPGNRRARRAA
jgi:hypothetical protein